MFKWLSKWRSKQGINDLPSEEERARLRPPPPSPEPLFRKGEIFNGKRKILIMEDIFSGDVVKASSVFYLDTHEFPKPGEVADRDFMEEGYRRLKERRKNGE